MRARLATWCLLILPLQAVADEGMWLLTRPPTEELQSRYGFSPTSEWLQQMQRSCVRFNTGGSGSVVSADGLVMTNHHVGRDILEKLSTPARDLLKTGFLASSRETELACPDLELDILWTIEDVSAAVNEAVTSDMTPAAANAARRKKIAEIKAAAEARDPSLKAEVVTLYHGARHHLYSYRRYTDVRLVMAPEEAIAFFGGDTANFEYPRYCLDVTFFRIYENGAPLKSENYLRWSHNGAADGELVLIFGHPARTQRQFTVDHIKFLRDVNYPQTLHRLWRREVQLAVFRNRSEENARIAAGEFFGYQNSRKARGGAYAGLLDPDVMGRIEAAEKQLREAVQRNPEFNQRWGTAWDRIAKAESAYAQFHLRHRALEVSPALGSDLFRIARHVVRLAAEQAKPDADRLPEYQEASRDSLLLSLYSPAPIYDELEINRLESGFSYLAEVFGADDPLLVKALDGASPLNRARQLVRDTRLKDVAERRRLAEGGQAAIEESLDPMIQLALILDPESRASHKRYQDEVESLERAAYADIAAAKFEIYGETLPPDATGTLRLSYGKVQGYADGSTTVSPFTQMGGLYEEAERRQGDPLFTLPRSWVEKRDQLELSTPFNFVSTCDIIGGNSGSPVVNRAGEVVGLVFDGNIHSLPWMFAYTDSQARAVSVDSRAIMHALAKVYQADALVAELSAHQARAQR